MTDRQQPASTDECIDASQPHTPGEGVRRLALLLIWKGSCATFLTTDSLPGILALADIPFGLIRVPDSSASFARFQQGIQEVP